MGFSTCSMVVDDVHFHLFLFSLWLNVIAVMILNEWEWMEVVCWKMKLNLTIFPFLFFSTMMKTSKEWNLIRFVFHFYRFRRLLSILAKRSQSSFFLECDLRKHDFDQIGRKYRNLNRICKECFEFVLFCFFLIWGLLKRRNVERVLKSACSQQ